MSLIEIVRQKQRLDELFQKARKLPDPELQSHWSRYLCVLVSGFLENSVRITYLEFARKRADPKVLDFLDNRLQKFQNPKTGAILEITGAFSKEWKTELEQQIKGQVAESVNSIVNNRHKIAHGESVGLSLTSLTQYYDDAVKLIDLLQQQCGF